METQTPIYSQNIKFQFHEDVTNSTCDITPHENVHLLSSTVYIQHVISHLINVHCVSSTVHRSFREYCLVLCIKLQIAQTNKSNK